MLPRSYLEEMYVMQEKEKLHETCLKNITSVCYTNLTVLVLLVLAIGFTSIANYRVEAVLLQLHIIICAVLYNCTVLFDPSRKWELIPAVLSDNIGFWAVQMKDKALIHLPEIMRISLQVITYPLSFFSIADYTDQNDEYLLQNSESDLNLEIAPGAEDPNGVTEDSATLSNHSADVTEDSEILKKATSVIENSHFSEESDEGTEYVLSKDSTDVIEVSKDFAHATGNFKGTFKENPDIEEPNTRTAEQKADSTSAIKLLRNKNPKSSSFCGPSPFRTPELFKNRIYQIRKSLINEQKAES